MVKPNFFKAITAGVILYRVFRYIGAQRRLLEAYEFNIRQFNIAGFSADGDGRAVSNDFVDIQPYATSAVSFDVRVRPKDLGALGQDLLNKLQNLGSTKVRLVGQFSLETIPGVYKTIPVDFTDTIYNLFG